MVRPADQRIMGGVRDLEMTEVTIDALGRIGDPAVPALISALHDLKDRALRVAAARALARIGPPAQEAVPDLITALEDDDEDLRKAAVHALGQIGNAASAAVPKLMDELKEALAKEATGQEPQGGQSAPRTPPPLRRPPKL